MQTRRNDDGTTDVLDIPNNDLVALIVALRHYSLAVTNDPALYERLSWLAERLSTDGWNR